MKENEVQAAQDLAKQGGKWLLEELLAALPGALIHSLIFVLIAVVLIVVCQKFKVYTRPSRAWNVLTKLHYFVLVVTMMGLGFGLGLVSSFQKSGNRVLDEKLHPALTGMVPPAKEMILESLPPELAERPMTGEEIYNYIVEQMAATDEAADEPQEGGVMAEMGRELEVQVRIFLVKMLIDHAITKAGEKVGLSPENAKFSIEVFKSIDFSQKADEIATQATEAVKKQISGFAMGLRIQLLFYAFIVLVLLAIDPLIYFLIYKPRCAKDDVPPLADGAP